MRVWIGACVHACTCMRRPEAAGAFLVPLYLIDRVRVSCCFWLELWVMFLHPRCWDCRGAAMLTGFFMWVGEPALWSSWLYRSHFIHWPVAPDLHSTLGL